MFAFNFLKQVDQFTCKRNREKLLTGVLCIVICFCFTSVSYAAPKKKNNAKPKKKVTSQSPGSTKSKNKKPAKPKVTIAALKKKYLATQGTVLAVSRELRFVHEQLSEAKKRYKTALEESRELIRGHPQLVAARDTAEMAREELEKARQYALSDLTNSDRFLVEERKLIIKQFSLNELKATHQKKIVQGYRLSKEERKQLVDLSQAVVVLEKQIEQEKGMSLKNNQRYLVALVEFEQSLLDMKKTLEETKEITKGEAGVPETVKAMQSLVAKERTVSAKLNNHRRLANRLANQILSKSY